MKEIFEKYGSDFTVINPKDVCGLKLPCPVAVASKNGWQVEKYEDDEGKTGADLRLLKNFIDGENNG